MIASAAYRLRAMPTPFAPARILAQDLDRFWGGRSRHFRRRRAIVIASARGSKEREAEERDQEPEHEASDPAARPWSGAHRAQRYQPHIFCNRPPTGGAVVRWMAGTGSWGRGRRVLRDCGARVTDRPVFGVIEWRMAE